MMNPSGTEFPGDKIVPQSDLWVGTASDRIINEKYVNKKIKRGDPLAGVNGMPVSVPSTTCIEKSFQGFNLNNPHIKTLPAAVFHLFFFHSQTSVIVSPLTLLANM
jgi:hypothetical protein